MDDMVEVLKQWGLNMGAIRPRVYRAASFRQAALKAAIQRSPASVGIDLADWNWKVVHEFVRGRFGHTLSRSSCLNYLHRLDFVLKRPKKRLVKANAERWAAFVREYALLQAAAQASGAKLFFVDEAHFYADVDLRGTWLLRGQPALVDSTSPRWGEKASYYSAVCLEPGEVEVMELEGNSSATTSVTFLQQLRAHHAEPLIVIWDNGPAHGGDPLRTYLTTPDLRLRLVHLPAYGPDFNADEHLWAWVREPVGAFFRGLTDQTDEVKRRCRTVLQTQTQADAFTAAVQTVLQPATHVDPALALVESVSAQPSLQQDLAILVRTVVSRSPACCGAFAGRRRNTLWRGCLEGSGGAQQGVAIHATRC